MKKFRQSIYEEERKLLCKWLVTQRKSVGYTQRQLAECLEVVHSLVAKVENGERRLEVVEFYAYCSALGTTPSEFYKELEKLTSSQ